MQTKLVNSQYIEIINPQNNRLPKVRSSHKCILNITPKNIIKPLGEYV